jgi:two-component system, OmpR family, sensor kinase
MARHFLLLYAAIVATLAALSWGQERLWEAYGRDGRIQPDARETALASLVEDQIRTVPASERSAYVAQLAQRTGLDLELFERDELAGAHTLARLAQGAPARMRDSDGRTWMLHALGQSGHVLALRYESDPPQPRTEFEWALAFAFYAAIALVIMAWIWPLTRDLRALERATTRFGDRNWTFDAVVSPRSPVHGLAEAFRRMAGRIDALIRSHRDLSNAMSHEIKTPLSRMRFEIEAARSSADAGAIRARLDNLDADVSELNAFVDATLEYAILERAEMALNLAEHDFAAIVAGVTDAVRRTTRPGLEWLCEAAQPARVVCDAHLMETVLRNLLYNASRYAASAIRVSFAMEPAGQCRLCVEDDGPGVAETDRERVFESFVQLDRAAGSKTGFGLGLAIVARAVEWHGGRVAVSRSTLGGASFTASWPAAPPGYAP